MGLTERLARAAAQRPHVLLVPVPGHRPVLWAAEDALDELGWARAASPAGADLLLCCGEPGPELTPHVEVAWEGMPGPRVRATASAASGVRSALAAVAGLQDVQSQRRDARDRTAPRLSAADQANDPMAHDMPADAMQDDADAAKMHDGGMDSSMDMGMDLPGGLVMADRVEDRDGLRLEGLNLSLGPLLPDWPAGLRLDVVLSGDVLTQADVVRLDAHPEPSVPPALLALDALAVLLDAAGWSDGALRARRARREGGTGPEAADLLRRLRRARLLRWSLRGLPAPVDGDLSDHLDRLVAAARGEADLPDSGDGQLARAIVGLDVGTAALVVAAHAPLLPVPARA